MAPTWAMAPTETDEEKRKRKERELLAALFLLLLSDTDANLRRHALAFLTGAATIHATANAFATTLAGAHGHAAYLGRRLTGATAPFGFADAQFGASVARTQVPYAQGLLDDLEGGRYPLVDGNLPGDLSARLALYSKRVRGTAEEAWLYTLPPETRVNWVLGFNENHCPECPTLAAEGPYRADNMPTTPGSGDTPCLSSCHCFLITSDKQTCFQLPEDTP